MVFWLARLTKRVKLSEITSLGQHRLLGYRNQYFNFTIGVLVSVSSVVDASAKKPFEGKYNNSSERSALTSLRMSSH
jgi:hypothetical protein